YLASGVSSGRLRAVHVDDQVNKQDVVMICVGTPSDKNGTVDMTYVQSAIDWFFENTDNLIGDYGVLVLKSTCPPGTTHKLIHEQIEARGLSGRVSSAFNPEFLREGSAIWDTENPDRVVLGTYDEKTGMFLKEMYTECLNNSPTYVNMKPTSAEFCKYVSNCFLATKISFANEIANLVEKIPEADIDEVFEGVGLDARISPKFFGAGVGFGGSCFPKDTIGLVRYAEEELGVGMQILRATLDVNAGRPQHIIDLLMDCIDTVNNRKIAVLGLAFKPGTDDTRESPSFKVIDLLNKIGADVWVHDPLSSKMDLMESQSKITIADSVEDCVKDSYACILITEWGDYTNLGVETLTRLMKQKIFIDGRRVFARSSIPDDVIYKTIGTQTMCE
ncbi:MAG: UDP-glucose dehydrogenase family protein, partial [Candidatus Thorarchaeota archaeon]